MSIVLYIYIGIYAVLAYMGFCRGGGGGLLSVPYPSQDVGLHVPRHKSQLVPSSRKPTSLLTNNLYWDREKMW